MYGNVCAGLGVEAAAFEAVVAALIAGADKTAHGIHLVRGTLGKWNGGARASFPQYLSAKHVGQGEVLAIKSSRLAPHKVKNACNFALLLTKACVSSAHVSAELYSEFMRQMLRPRT